MQPRVMLLPELLTKSAFLRSTPRYPRLIPSAARAGLSVLSHYLAALDISTHPQVAYEQYLALIHTTEDISMAQALRSLRFALSAELAGPDLGESIRILGTKQLKERVQTFIKRALCP